MLKLWILILNRITESREGSNESILEYGTKKGSCRVHKIANTPIIESLTKLRSIILLIDEINYDIYHTFKFKQVRLRNLYFKSLK